MRALFGYIGLGSWACIMSSCASPYYAAYPAPVYYPLHRTAVFNPAQTAGVYNPAPGVAYPYRAPNSETGRPRRPASEQLPAARPSDRQHSGEDSGWIDPEP